MSEKRQDGLTGVALYMALLVILVWLGMLAWLAHRTVTATEVVWSRLLVVLASLEAVTFGAAGALFGTQIQRQRVVDAKDRAEKAEKESAEHKDDATKGRALAATVKAEAKVKSAGKGPERLSIDPGSTETESAALILANEFFPD